MKFLMFTSLQTLRTHHCLHFQYDVSNVPSHTEHVKRSLETSKIEKRPKSADLVVLRLSQREKIFRSHYLQEKALKQQNREKKRHKKSADLVHCLLSCFPLPLTGYVVTATIKKWVPDRCPD